MNPENIIPALGWLLIVAILAAPAAKNLFNNLRMARRIRKHEQNLPGPLLGVVYPQHKDGKK